MNKIIIIALSAVCYSSCNYADRPPTNLSLIAPVKATIPKEVITPGECYWKKSTAATKQQTNGVAAEIIKAKFEKKGTFRFLYEAVEVTGTVEFTKNKAGKKIFRTHAANSILRNGKTQADKLKDAALLSSYSHTYLWERISFPGIASEDFLLLVDLDAHPEAASAKAGTINKNWVLKFNIAAP